MVDITKQYPDPILQSSTSTATVPPAGSKMHLHSPALDDDDDVLQVWVGWCLSAFAGYLTGLYRNILLINNVLFSGGSKILTVADSCDIMNRLTFT